MRNNFHGLSFLTITLLLSCSNPAAASGYTFTNLGTLGGTYSSAFGINNTGQIVGSAFTAGNASAHATRWSDGTITDLSTFSGGSNSLGFGINNAGDVAGYGAGFRAVLWTGSTSTNLGTLGGPYSTGRAINNLGQVVGESRNAENTASHATLWSGGTVTDLTPLAGSDFSYAFGINDMGQITGYSYTTAHVRNATVWDGATTTYLDMLGGTDSSGNAINNAGQVAGGITAADGTNHAALWSGATTLILGTAGGTTSNANALNNFGQVVGDATTSDSTTVAVLWDGTTAINLNSFLDVSTVSAGWLLVSATGINDQGQIVGNAYNESLNLNHAFLLTPVPEPLSYSTLLVGLGLMGFVSRRKKHGN